jgi:Pyruvate/2-oxoacid:ferredoxin oxidoreductase delta subunit
LCSSNRRGLHGTFRPDELIGKRLPQPLAEEALQFARQGGINPYRYRPACQICIDPLPANANITVDLLGLPARTSIVISSCDEVAERYQLGSLSDGKASPELIEQHDRVHQLVLARRERMQTRLAEVLNGELAMDVDSLTAHLAGCEICQRCFGVCPIFEHIVPDPGNMTRNETIRWLLACAGCGMCEVACSDHLPLTQIMNQAKATLVETLANNDPIIV